ncbi:MAG: acyl-CoA/acyl-ACP dehydrogenase [Candidatus Lokiarchaeota archaeon]|nr:acyl-CoA/acyl-ACP dehydrogenase [Candidatus Lokiarchaeota archaeon]
MSRYMDKVINDEILEKLSLKNRYNFINNNLMAILSPEQFNHLKKVQKFCLRFEKKNAITHGPNEDIYDWIPAFGAEGYVTRLHNFEMIDINYDYYGAVADFLRYLAVDMFDPQFAMGSGATVLAMNPIYEHHENIPVRLEALKDLATGKAAGCICITEPERGSDAVHQLTTCDEQDDGSFILNGEKVYTTNAPKSKWAVAYATAEQNNGNQMAQFLIDTSLDGWKCERVNIPWVPKLYLGHEYFENLRVPKDFVLGGVGKGREHLFEGLVPERIGIACGAISQCWGAVSHAAIYANLRKQFDQEILKFQGVGFLLTDIWARTTNLTLGLLKFAEVYDEKMEKFEGRIPGNISRAMVASASQFKYHATNLSSEVCYEAANLMGGAGLSDNTLMYDYVNISRIQEIVGGSRQIQQYIMSMALRQLFKML